MKLDTAKPKYNIDAHRYYQSISFNPLENFNKTEITLSHLLRKKMAFLGNRNYSDCLFDFFNTQDLLDKYHQNIIEIGGGLGDVAFNLAKRLKEEGIDCKYRCYDISPNLCDYQNMKLNEIDISSYCCDALFLNEEVSEFDGIILCNGVIADLRSIFISKDKTASYYTLKPEWDKAIEEIVNFKKSDNFYLHIGTLELLKILYHAISDNGAILISEYKASPINQPSDFGTHYECGIDFEQLIFYANKIGFHTELFSCKNVLGAGIDNELLTMDIFTRDWTMLMSELPIMSYLLKAGEKLPVLAYTRESFEETISNPDFCLTSEEVKKIVKQFDLKFDNINSEVFDSRNPTTWNYEYLLLKKAPFNKDLIYQAADLTFKEYFKLSDDEVKTVRNRVQENLNKANRGFFQSITVVYELLDYQTLIYLLLITFGKSFYNTIMNKIVNKIVESLSAKLKKIVSKTHPTRQDNYKQLTFMFKKNIDKLKEAKHGSNKN